MFRGSWSGVRSALHSTKPTRLAGPAGHRARGSNGAPRLRRRLSACRFGKFLNSPPPKLSLADAWLIVAAIAAAPSHGRIVVLSD
jgi:hypothetical protein